MSETVVVVGSGVMGRGIAYVSALGGYRVKLVDVLEAALDSARKEIQAIFQKGMARGKVTAEQAGQAEKNLFYTTNLEEAVRDAQLVIEAVPEKKRNQEVGLRGHRSQRASRMCFGIQHIHNEPH